MIESTDSLVIKLLLRRAACRLALGQGEEAEADYRYDSVF